MSVCEKQNDTQNFQNTLKFKQSKKTNSGPHSFNTEYSTESEVKFEPEVAEWRRAIPEDKDAIQELVPLTGDIVHMLFRRQSINELIETTYFPIVQFDTKGDLVSFAAFDSFPDLEAIPFMWEDWLTINYKIKGIAAGNVVFIHYMVWHPDYKEKFLPLLLETLFTEFALVNQIIIVRPPNIEPPEFLSKYFFSVLPSNLENLDISSVQLLLVCLRSAIIQPLYIRIAFEQEFDFIMSVISDDFKKTKKDYTTYFWGFLHDFYEKDKKTLICELEGQLVGIMILNLKIDLDVLNEWFELEPFNGLKKKEFDKPNTINESLSFHEISFNKDHKEPKLLVSSEYLFSHMNWEMMLSKVQPNTSFFLREDSNTSSNDSEFSQVSIFRLSSSYDSDDSSTSSYQDGSTLFKIGAFNLVIRTSESTTTRFFPPKYRGDSNAFVIDLFAIDCNKLDEKLSSFDFLKAAFKIVPDKDYCVLLIPTDLIPFPLMDSFVRVTPRPTSNFKQELYLCHKNSLAILSISVRSTERQDLASIKYFLKNVDEGDTVYHDILNNCFKEKNNFKSFVLTFEETIVGVSLLNSELNNENFHKYFEIAEIKYSSFNETEKFSVIQHLVINPIYHNHARFFVRDIMRLEAVNCLYYIYHKPCKNRPNLLTVLGELAPIKPKKKVGFFDPFRRIIETDLQDECISLYFLNPRLCGFHKIHINIVLVVVGASRTALSFLENLIFGPESWLFNYNNIICITSNSLETSNTDKDLRHLMFANYDSFSEKYISMLSLGTYVHFIYGIMTGINRSEKYIVVNNKANVKYDYLILTCGLQYSTPTPEAKKLYIKKNCGNNFTSPLARFLPQKFASIKRKLYLPKYLNNLFIINTNSDAQNALRVLQIFVQKLEKTGDKKIILYGHDLQVFLTIHTLLKLGIPGEFIVFVEPFPKGTITLFNDYAIDQAVIESVKNLNVKYYTNYILYDWSVSPEDYITTIRFHSHCKQLVIPCLAFFPFLEKLVSEVNFNACQDAGLVYDGRLVINHNFRTNDKYIYAAGPFTKYARRYFATEYNHQFFNSREVGEKLAEIIKRLISPYVENKHQEEESSLVPKLKAPIMFHCQLPGDYNLFMLRKPGKEIDLETAYNFFDYGQVLTTGNCQMKSGYFRLHLNQEGFVESIACYTKDKIDYANLSTLYGLHERILNNLVLRFDMALIPDFFGYFRQPWAMALFHDDFQLLREHNFKIFFKKIYENKSFNEKVIEELKANKWQSLPDSSIEELELKYLHSKIPEDITNNLLHFLESYKKDLPMYATSKRMKYMIKQRLWPSFTQWISAYEV